MAGASELDSTLASARFALELFDRLPGVVFFAKNGAGQYVAVNITLVHRLGMKRKDELLGRTTADLFLPPLGARYLAQDLGVCRSGREISDLLELHLYPNRLEGWCVTNKSPLRGRAGRIIGLVGTSRDVHAPASGARSLEDLAETVRHIQEHYAEPLRVDRLAAMARMSPYQLMRRVRALFGLTPAQLIIKTRVDAARHMLHGSEPIGLIAVVCGYCDQSALTRQFKAVVGLTPAQYREQGQANADAPARARVPRSGSPDYS